MQKALRDAGAGRGFGCAEKSARQWWKMQGEGGFRGAPFSGTDADAGGWWGNSALCTPAMQQGCRPPEILQAATSGFHGPSRIGSGTGCGRIMRWPELGLCLARCAAAGCSVLGVSSAEIGCRQSSVEGTRNAGSGDDELRGLLVR